MLVLRRRLGLAYFTMHATKHGIAVAYVMQSDEFLSECRRAKYFFSQSSKPNKLILNTTIYDSVCLKGPPHG